MIRRNMRVVAKACGLFVLAAGMTGASGCVVLTDLINPSLLPQLGIDPTTVTGGRGVVIVAVLNRTDVTVEFQIYQADDPDDLTLGVQTVQACVNAGNNGTEVFQCPTGSISLGVVGDDFQVANTGAVIVENCQQAAAQPQAVVYDGAALVEGVDYECGDVLEFTITPVAQGGQGGGQAGFQIRGIVRKGR